MTDQNDKELGTIPENIDINISISNDYYKAYLDLNIYEADTGFKKEDILNALNKRNISYGVDMEKIEQIIKNQTPVKNVLIALGEPHINGEDGKIIYNFDISNISKPVVMENGNVDHKNLNYIQRINKGEIIASRVPPTEGSDGITVTGKTIKAKPGKNHVFKPGKNVKISADNSLLIAEKSGLIKFIDEKINVIPILEINNVGIATGNIYFNGKVIVKGNVEKGYILNSDDDIEIHGLVEGSEITSKGNIIIHHGCNNGAILFSDKSIITKFMEGCTAEANEDIVCEAVLHCNITSKQNLIVDQGKGLIIGGNINVRGDILAKTIGSLIGTSTKIQVGIDPELLEKYKELTESIKLIKENIKKIDQALSLLENQSKIHSGDDQLSYMLEKSFNTKKQSLAQLNDYNNDLRKILLEIEDLKNSKVSADTIFPGVKIKINNSHYNSRNVLKNITLIKDEGEIRSQPRV